jgi:hypothetical protein
MNRQEKILKETALHHGITLTQAQEVWHLFTTKVAETLNAVDVKTDGYFDLSKFNVVHIDNFGKFIPNTKGITVANTLIKQAENK